MSRSHVVGLGPWCMLVLLVLSSLPALARGRARPSEEEGDPVCVRDDVGPCEKLRVGLVGGGILSSADSAPGFGVKGGLSFVLNRRAELGVNVLVMTDVRVREGTYLGAGEGMLRIATLVAPHRRLFLELSGGVALSSLEGASTRYSPSGSVGTSLEWARNGTGFFLNAGLTVLRAERWTALPHAGLGVAF